MNHIEYYCLVKVDSWDRNCKYGNLSIYKSPCNKCDSLKRDDGHKRPSHWEPNRRTITQGKRQTRSANKRSTARKPRPKLAKRKLRAA
jgi:hypothetical protein